MGILDDAIRQHLELKRKHGAESEDLERLENEAFGPATRPGDPEFTDPDTGTSEAASAEVPPPGPEAATPAPPAAEGTGDGDDIPAWLGREDATTVAPAAGEEAESAAEQARVEHAELGDTADHPAPKQLGPEDEAERAPSEPAPSVDAPEPPEPPESAIFDAPADEFDFGDLDLDEEPAPTPPIDPAESAPPEQPPMTPPTTDHDLPPAPVRPVTDRGGRSPPPAEGETGAATDEDLLEETPDFLQDAPEGEDLWFEQGPPKDFDFDDDEKD